MALRGVGLYDARTMRSVVTIGNFDGVHAGHAALVRAARDEADRIGGPRVEPGAERPSVVAMVFDPHPAALLAPARVPSRLSRFEQRRACLEWLGVDRVVRLEPTRTLLDQSPREFLAWAVREHGASAFVEGEDFRFGKGRAGDVRAMRTIGEELGFAVRVVPPVERELTDQVVVRVSSTLVRWLVEQGRMTDVARLLDRAYEIVGTVERGDRRGRTIGFPTLNIATDQMLPGDGVYAGRAALPDGRACVAAISVGTKPHFQANERASGSGGEPARVLEAHLLDVPRDGERISGLAEYGWAVRLQIGTWLREQWRFASLEALVAQLVMDCERSREVVGKLVASVRGAPLVPRR